MFILLPLSPLFQTMPEPPPVGSGIEVYLNYLFYIAVVFLIAPYIKALINKKKGGSSSGSLADVYSQIADLHEKHDKLEKKNGEILAENKLLKTRIKTLETQNKELKERLDIVETENDDLITIVRFTSPAVNKVLNETTNGMNKLQLEKYHDILSKYDII